MRSAAVATLLVATCVVIATAAPTDADGASIFKGPIGPNPALGPLLTTTGPNKGHPCVDCILVGVTTCCKTWERTEKLLRQMLATNDNLHIAVFDDMSEDDTRARAEAMGLPVIQPPRLENVGLTKMMNLMWRYFYARPELVSMFVVNNDLEISPYRTFEKLNKCLLSFEGPGVVSAMTNAEGLGTGTHMSAYMSWQNAEHSRHNPNYGGLAIPKPLRDGLPGTIVEYNKWLEQALEYKSGETAYQCMTLMGFLMGFKRNHPLYEPAANRFIHAGRNAHQEYNMFQLRQIPAYVCQDTFVFHNKSATASAHIREAMLKNKLQVNKKGQLPGQQS